MRFRALLVLGMLGALPGTCFASRPSAKGSPVTEATLRDRPTASPQVRIRTILAKPFRGDPDNHAVFFLDDHEDQIREIGKAGVPTLVRALESADSEVRLKAVLCLSVLGADAAPAVNMLRPLLKSRVDRQAYWTIICLGEIGKASIAAVPDLLSLLKHPRGSPFWEQIGEAIGRIAIKNGRLPEGLSELLNHKRPGARQGALFALGECRALTGPFIPNIIVSLRDRHLLVRIHAALALGKIRQRPELAIPALRRALYDPKASVRGAAATAIGDFVVTAAGAVPDLINLLRARSPQVRVQAATALGKIGPAARAAIPALEKALKARERPVRQAAQRALDSIRTLDERAK
jgi:HEAT repeat protein